MVISVYTHRDCLAHDTGPGHPEQIARLSVVLDALRNSTLPLSYIDAPAATDRDTILAHDPALIAAVHLAAPTSGHAFIDGDTVMSTGTLTAALRAAGAGIAAVDAAIDGKIETAFCAVRPPGHHATRARAMGFCFFNNIAIAAKHAIERRGLERVAIVDFDVHHGNGTQDIVAGDSRILYISTHQMPLFPGTGRRSENRDGILNIPLMPGTDGAAYREEFMNMVLPALDRFAPQLLLVSAGFDAHRDDPLAGLELVEDDYRWIGQQLRAVAEKHCTGKVISFLEGGYNLEHLAKSVVAYLEAWA